MKRNILSLILILALAFTLISCNKKENVDLTNLKSVADLKNYGDVIIGAQEGTYHLEILKKEAPENVTVKSFDDFTALLVALQSHAIDGYVAEEPTAISNTQLDTSLTYIKLENNTTGFSATDADTGIAIAFKTGSEYVSQVNEILKNISEDTKLKLMTQACTMAQDKDKALSEDLALVSSKANDAKTGTLKVAMECAYDPFNWTQTTTANGAVPISGKTDLYANGYDVQIAKYVADELGLNLEVYSYDWDSLIPAVNSSSVDCICAGMSPTAEREIEVDFTDCYYNSNLVIIINKGN